MPTLDLFLTTLLFLLNLILLVYFLEILMLLLWCLTYWHINFMPLDIKLFLMCLSGLFVLGTYGIGCLLSSPFVIIIIIMMTTLSIVDMTMLQSPQRRSTYSKRWTVNGGQNCKNEWQLWHTHHSSLSLSTMSKFVGVAKLACSASSFFSTADAGLFLHSLGLWITHCPCLLL